VLAGPQAIGELDEVTDGADRHVVELAHDVAWTHTGGPSLRVHPDDDDTQVGRDATHLAAELGNAQGDERARLRGA